MYRSSFVTKSLCVLSALMSLATVNGVLTYNDQKTNCSKYVTNTYCYDGPRFDSIGQYKACSVPGTIALTFDDGPSDNIPGVLDMLQNYNMKATFFLIGLNVYYQPSHVQRMVDEGHQIGAHTFTHPYLSDLTLDQIRQEFRNFENSILMRNFSGVLANRMLPTFFRAPHGALSADQLVVLSEFGMYPMHWGWLNSDSYTTDPNDILPFWKSHMGMNGEGTMPSRLSLIVQQHEREPATYGSLQSVLDYLYINFASKGVRFVTLAECLGNSIKPYQVATRRYEDPTCATGITATQGTNRVCCDSACGTCGGDGCGTRPGGSFNCCVTNILSANVSCQYSKPPCIVSPLSG